MTAGAAHEAVGATVRRCDSLPHSRRRCKKKRTPSDLRLASSGCSQLYGRVKESKKNRWIS